MNRRQFFAASAALVSSSAPALALSGDRDYNFNFGSVFNTQRQASRYRGKEIIVFKTKEAPGTVIINTGERRLYYVMPSGKAICYGVGVGRQGFEWSGVAQIGFMKSWPEWHPPKEMIVRELRQYGRRLPDVMPGGPDNPLGARALYLYQGTRDTLYRIHGTNAPQTIGQAMSSGCIRMLNQDVIELYRRAPIGTRVLVLGPGV
jgi:lipoprotein-anchoring transpeptidase ErfK/SrfK